jgi:DNA-binding transcriptional MerR regulator
MSRARHLSIGRFAGLTGISANTLRRYDEYGLLSPAFTDPLTGYRLYAVEQLDTGVAIRLLRDLDVPLDDLRVLLSGEHPDDVRTLLTHHRERIVERRADLERILARIDAVLHDDHGLLPYELEVVDLAPVWVVSRRLTTTRAALDPAIERSLAELADELAADGVVAVGRELILYANPLQWYQGLDVEVCLPVAEAGAAACGARLLEGCRAARTVYRGPWDDIWQAYAALLAQIARRGLDVCGPVRESYLVDERDTDDPARYLTEIAWPVRPRASAEETPAEPPTRVGP